MMFRSRELAANALRRRAALRLAAAFFVAATACAGVAPRVAAAAADGEIQVLGEGERTLYLVERDGKWSMHAENLLASDLFQLWRMVGGPRALAKKGLDYPFTLSVHGMTAERIVARVLEGYGYTLHYRTDGKLDEVHVYSARETFSYKTPRLTETRTRWAEAENASLPKNAAADAEPAPRPEQHLPSPGGLPPIGSAEAGDPPPPPSPGFVVPAPPPEPSIETN